MADVFVSYARSTAKQAQAVGEALRRLGYSVWLDDELPAHRDYSEVIEERLRGAKAVVVLWSAEAVKSQWVRAEADLAREAGSLVQLSLDDSIPPLPFNRIQCADLAGWSGDAAAPGWRKVVASVGELVGARSTSDVVRLEGAPPLPDKPSIAVLPFADMTVAKDRDYFTDGMVVEIVTALTRFPSLFVIASGSGLSYRDGTRDLKRIAQELGVRYLLEGSVRKSGDLVRIAVQLVDTKKGAHVWAERFDGTLEDVFALQDSVANAVAGQIAPMIEAAEIRRANARPTQDLGAYDLYLRAVHAFRSWGKESFLTALDLLDRAIARDPDYALALAFAGYGRGLLVLFGWSDNPQEAQRVGLELAQRALRLAGDDPDVLAYVSNAIGFIGGDMAAAETLMKRSLARNSGSSFSWYMSAWLKFANGQPARALEQFRTALRLDPQSPERPVILNGMGSCLLALRRFDEALPLLKEAVELRPDNESARFGLGVTYAHLGKHSEARVALETLSAATMEGLIDVLRDADLRDLIRAGLARARAHV